GLKAVGGTPAMELTAAKPLPHPAASTTAASARQVEPVSVEEMWELVYWLDELRQTNEQVKDIPEAEWQEFMKRVYLTFEYLE
ncbi:MAG: hypothetical protein JW810_11820, partial [Sedimentisphaerales bacterium]|nr:hypothetical protein [Sedimentisphaerales bacterium]